MVGIDHKWALAYLAYTCSPLEIVDAKVQDLIPRRIKKQGSKPTIATAFKKDPEDRFWLSAKAPHKAVSTRTLSEWLRFVIKEAGNREGLAREVRSVGLSVAVQSNFDLKQALAAGNWQRLSTVRRHYFRPQSLQSLSQILKVAK